MLIFLTKLRLGMFINVMLIKQKTCILKRFNVRCNWFFLTLCLTYFKKCGEGSCCSLDTGHKLKKSSEDAQDMTYSLIKVNNTYLIKVNNSNTRKSCKICSQLKIKAIERRHWRRSCVFIVNFEHISHLFLVFVLLTLNK